MDEATEAPSLSELTKVKQFEVGFAFWILILESVLLRYYYQAQRKTQSWKQKATFQLLLLALTDCVILMRCILYLYQWGDTISLAGLLQRESELIFLRSLTNEW